MRIASNGMQLHTEDQIKRMLLAAMLVAISAGQAHAQDAAAGEKGLSCLQGLSPGWRQRQECRRAGPQRAVLGRKVDEMKHGGHDKMSHLGVVPAKLRGRLLRALATRWR